MKVLIVGSLDGRLTAATKLALDKGATVAHATDVGEALSALRLGQGADLLVVDTAVGIGELVRTLEAERIRAPIVACGTAGEAHAAAAQSSGASGSVGLHLFGRPVPLVPSEPSGWRVRPVLLPAWRHCFGPRQQHRVSGRFFDDDGSRRM